MAFRVTEKRLANQCEYLNRITDSPAEYSREVDGRWRANPGHYHMNYDYNQPQLQRVCNDGGGVEDVLGYRGTKGEVDRMLGAFIKGIEMGKREPTQ